MDQFIWFLVSLVVSYALAPRPPKKKPASLEDFELPTAEEGRPIPVAFGSPLIRGLNTLWYGNLESSEVIKGDNLISSGYTAGILYRIDLHLGICHGPIEELSLYVDDKNIAHHRSVNGVTTHELLQPMTAPGEHEVFLPDFFGGYRKEGGLVGFFEWLNGDEAQPNSYLVENMSSQTPGYKGIAQVLFKNFYLTANSTYLKAWSAKVKRISTGWEIAVPNPTKAEIGDGQMNPGHIIYECLTNAEWGMGNPVADVDDVVFSAAMDRLYDEGFGLSLVWMQQTPVEDFIQEVANHIGAQVYVNPFDGKWGIKLIRDDYDPALLDVYDDSNSELVSFERGGYHERINELTVNFQTPEGKPSSITMHNLAAIQSAGAVISQTVDYPGIRSADLAARVCLRDLKVLSAPLSKLVIKANRYAWALKPGDVFKYSNDDYGLTSVVYRVIKITKGTLENPEITITATEDYFGLPTNAYSAGQGGLWVDTNTPPVDITNFKFVEQSYIELARLLSVGSASSLGQGLYVKALAAKPATQNTFLSLMHSDTNSSSSFEEVVQTSYTKRDTLTSIVDRQETTLLFSGSSALREVSAGTLALVNDELIQIDSINPGNGSAVVTRAVGDTLPGEHSVGDTVWFIERITSVYNTDNPPANNYFKLLGVNNIGITDPQDFTSVLMNPTYRHLKPYPAANVRVNSQYWPQLVAAGDFSVAWSARNRTAQQDNAVGWYANGQAPDGGDSYTLIIRDPNNTILQNNTGLTANGSGEATYTYSGAKHYRYTIELTCNGSSYDSDTLSMTFDAGDVVTVDNAGGETSINVDAWTMSARAGVDGPVINRSFYPDMVFQPRTGNDCFAAANNVNRTICESYLDIDLTLYRTDTEIDAGGESVFLEWFQNFEVGNCQIGFDIVWLDSGSAEISTTSFTRNTTTAMTWTKREETAVIPANARTARLYMTIERTDGQYGVTYLDGGIDDIAMRIF